MSLLIVGRFVANSLRAGTRAEEPEISGKTTSEKDQEEFLTVTDVNIRARPNGKGERVGLAEKGSRVRVIGKYKNWRQIIVIEHGRNKEDPESLDEGWIDASTLTTLPDDRT
jgi:hypothetical protein